MKQLKESSVFKYSETKVHELWVEDWRLLIYQQMLQSSPTAEFNLVFWIWVKSNSKVQKTMNMWTDF